MEQKKKEHKGRVKGTPNKVSTKTKEVIASLLTEYSNSGKMSNDFNSLDPKDRLMIAEKLMQYVMPKMQATSIDVEGASQRITIESRLIEMSEEE